MERKMIVHSFVTVNHMGEVKIRIATIEDLEDVLRLNHDLFVKEYEDFDTSLDREWTYGEVGKEYFVYRITGSDGFVAVASDGESIIGYLCGGLKDRQFHVEGIYAELENMIVSAGYRGQGIGKRLMTDFLDWCDANAVNRVVVMASAGNVDGIEFYRKAGFSESDTTLAMMRKPFGNPS